VVVLLVTLSSRFARRRPRWLLDQGKHVAACAPEMTPHLRSLARAPCRACYVSGVETRNALVVWSSLALLAACQLAEEKPAAAPTAEPAPTIVGPGPLPPEEQAPVEEPAPPPAEARPVEPGITKAGAPTRGTLPKAVIDEKLASAQPGVRGCYEAALKTKPDLRGSVNLSFVVAPDGKVAHAEVLESENPLDDAAAVECIVATIKRLEFPAPNGGRVFLNYPLQLEPPK
jgi:hypothetical protein